MENRSLPPTGCIFCLHIYPSAISILMRRWWLTWECVVVTTTCAIIVAVATERRIEGADDVSHALRGHSALEYSRTLSNENCSSMFDECFFVVFDVHSIDDATIATMRWIIDEYGCPVLVAPTTWADSLIHAHIRQTHSEHTGDEWRAMSRLHIFLFSSASSEWQSYKVNKSYLLWMERAAEWCRLNMTVVMEHDGGDKACLTRRTIKNYCSKFHFMAIAIATTRSAECEEWILWGKQKQADTHTHGMARLVNCVIYSH